jgi:hypothetical protein
LWQKRAASEIAWRGTDVAMRQHDWHPLIEIRQSSGADQATARTTRVAAKIKSNLDSLQLRFIETT